MLNEKVEDALNGQLVQELHAASIYYSMAGYMHSVDLDGAARWLKAQTQEELTHAARFSIPRAPMSLAATFSISTAE